MKRPAAALLLRLLVTAGVLGYVVSRLDLTAAMTAVARIDPASWGVIATVLAADRGLAASRWIALVRASGIPLAYPLGLRLFLVSSFLGSFLPAGVGGDVARTWALRNRTARGLEAVVAAAADRWLGLTSVLVLGVVGLAAWTGPRAPAVGAALHGLLALALLGGLAGAFADRLAARLLPPAWAAHATWAGAARLAAAVRRLRFGWPAVLLAAASSFLLQAVRIVLAWLIGRGLGIEAPLAYYFVVMPLGIVLILLPISIGGLGPAQGAIIWMLRPLHVPDAVSFAMSTLFILLGFAANLPGAALYLRRR